MRIRHRLVYALRDPRRFAALARRALELARRGQLGRLLARMRPRDTTAAEYTAWHVLATAWDAGRARDAPQHFNCRALLDLHGDDPMPVITSLGNQSCPCSDTLVRDASEIRQILGNGSGNKSSPLPPNAVDAASCDWVLWITEPIVLEQHAVAIFALAAAANPDALFFYADDVQVQRDGKLLPRFKPAWDRVLIREQPYVGPLLLIHRSIAALALEAHGTGSAGQWRAMRTFASTFPEKAVVHIPAVLSRRPFSELPAIVYGRSSYDDENVPVPEAKSARHADESDVRVSIIIPTRDRARLLKRCVRSVRTHTPSDAYELVLVDNATRERSALDLLRDIAEQPSVRVLRQDEPFNFVRLCNAGAAAAQGRVVVFLNNDAAFTHDGWLDELASLALLPDIGAVGPVLVYGDGVMQSAGVLLGVNGTSTHALNGRRSNSWITQSWLGARRRVSAVTGACIAIERAKFAAVGGMDEKFAISHNELDLCLRLQQRGWMNVLTPKVRVVHDEGGTRGFELHRDERALRLDEEGRFLARWREVLRAGDPAHNPNFRVSGDPFALAEPTIDRTPRRGWAQTLARE